MIAVARYIDKVKESKREKKLSSGYGNAGARRTETRQSTTGGAEINKEEFVKREYGFQAMTASSLPSSVPSLGPDAEDDDADSVFSQSDDCDADLLEESELETDDEMHVATDEEEIYEKTSRTRRPKRSMEFLGMKVCQYAFQGLLGIGGSTLNRLRKDESAFTQSRRPEKPKHPVFGFCLDGQRKWVGVLMFHCQQRHTRA